MNKSARSVERRLRKQKVSEGVLTFSLDVQADVVLQNSILNREVGDVASEDALKHFRYAEGTVEEESVHR